MIDRSDNGVIHLFSTRTVSQALEQLLSVLRTKGITVFAIVDHSGEAAKVGLWPHIQPRVEGRATSASAS